MPDWSRTLIAASWAWTAACTSRSNPVLLLPPPEYRVYLVGRVLGDSGVLAGAVVQLNPLGDSVGTGRRPVGTDGRFKFDSLRPGPYVLVTRSIGYFARHDTFALSAPPGLDVQLTLRVQRICLDLCPADPRLVEAALMQQHRWQCDQDPLSIRFVRERWAEFLADSALRAVIGHELTSTEIARALKPVRRNADCRRLAAAAYEAPTTLAFTVFRWREYWLLSDPGFDEATMTDAKFRPVARSVGGGFAYWIDKPRLLKVPPH